MAISSQPGNGRTTPLDTDLVQATLDSSLDVIQAFDAVRDGDGRIVDFVWAMQNRRGVEQNGDVIGKSLLQQNPGVVATGIFDDMVTVMETGKPNEKERHYVSEQFDGWFYQALVPTSHGVAMTTRNITAHKMATQQILSLKDEITRRAEDRYRSLFRSIDEGFCIIEMQYDGEGKAVDYRFEEVNEAYLSHTGQDDPTGKLGREVAPDTEQYWVDTYDKVARTGVPVRFENYHVGSGRYYESYASRIGGAGSRQVAIVFEDTTERKLAGVALQESEDRYRTLLENLPDYAIFRLDPAGMITEWTAGAQQMTGYTAQQAVGQHLSLFYPPEAVRSGQVDAELAEAARAGRIEREGPRIRPNGERYIVNEIATAIRDHTGTVTGFTKISRDITLRKQMEEALRLADQRKDEFLAMLAHELRNPMATIRSGLQVLGMISGRDEASSKTIGMMNRQTDHLVRMVDDLLDVSRISRGKIELKKQRLDLVELVRQVVETLRPLYQQHGRTLHIDLPDFPIHVDGDATRLTQIVSNLLTNGVRYTGDRGEVWLTVEPLGHASARHNVLIQVRDNGIGIAEDQLSAIFELFMQVDNSLARSKGGLGVGLTIVKRLAEMHGGRVAAQSDGLGKGSTFFVYLPALITPATPSAPQGNLPGMRRILVIDDDADAAVTLTMLLQLKGHDVHYRTSGLEGIDAVAKLRPDAILLDIGMPDLDGYTTCRRLRDEPAGKSAAIIALTGYGMEEDRQRTREAGFDAHLVKPVDLDTLTNVLNELLSADRS